MCMLHYISSLYPEMLQGFHAGHGPWIPFRNQLRDLAGFKPRTEPELSTQCTTDTLAYALYTFHAIGHSFSKSPHGCEHAKYAHIPIQSIKLPPPEKSNV